TSNAGLVDGGTLSEISRKQILLCRNSVVGIPGEIARALRRALRIVDMPATLVLVGKAEDIFQVTFPAKGFEELQEGLFTLTTNCIINVGRIQRGIGVVSWEVPAPDNRKTRVISTEIAQGFNSTLGLRSGHDRDSKRLHLFFMQPGVQSFLGPGVQVSVNDRVFLTALEHCRDGQYGERKSTVESRAPHRTRIIEENHIAFAFAEEIRFFPRFSSIAPYPRLFRPNTGVASREPSKQRVRLLST